MNLSRAGWILLLCFASCAGPSSRPAADRPNLVFVLLDNLGPEWMGCYGSDENVTPNIDALARNGLRAEHCYTPPICSLSRVVLMTGRYPFRTGWTVHHDAALYGGGGLGPDRQVVVARPLRESGYATGIVGKWQINDLYAEPGVLERHGFQEHLVWPGGIDRKRVSGDAYRKFREDIRTGRADILQETTRAIESRYWDPVFFHHGSVRTVEGRFGPDVMQEFARDFMKRHRDRPFFLYYPMVLTHGQSYLDPVVETPLNRGREMELRDRYVAMVRYADRQIGELAAMLDELGLRRNTILFVATDNGTESRFAARRRGRVAKGGLYKLSESGSDVPLLVNGPGLVPPGRTCSLTDFTDIYPTLCELAGAALPEGVTLDGRSLAPVILGRAADHSRDWIFNQVHERRVVRGPRYTLYSTGEYYDVANDPSEEMNLAGTESGEVRAERRRLQAVLDRLPPDTPLPFVPRSLSGFRARKKSP